MVEEEVVGFTDGPSEEDSLALTRMGRELVLIDEHIGKLEQQLSDRRARRKEITDRELPEYLIRVGQDRLGLPEFNVDLVLENYTHANIAADWEPERRDAAFRWLEENGHGDLVKVEMVLLFPRTALKLARWVQGQLAKLKVPAAIGGTVPAAGVGMGVPWNTLTAWAKEQIKKGTALPLDTLGITTGRIVKIKQRDKPRRAE